MATHNQSRDKSFGPGSGSGDTPGQASLAPSMSLDHQEPHRNQVAWVIALPCDKFNHSPNVTGLKTHQQGNPESPSSPQSEPPATISTWVGADSDGSGNIRNVGGITITFNVETTDQFAGVMRSNLGMLASLRPTTSARAGERSKNSANVEGCGETTLNCRVGAMGSAGGASK